MYVKSLFCQIVKNLTKFNNPYDFAVGISIIRADPKCCNIGTGVDQDQNHGTLLNTKTTWTCMFIPTNYMMYYLCVLPTVTLVFHVSGDSCYGK
jgi:hypothetical protein